MPSKTLLSIARQYEAMKGADTRGLPKVDVAGGFDFAKVMEHVDSVVQGIYANEQASHFEELGIDVYIDHARAAFLNKNEIRIGGETIWADYTIIATGSSPRMAPHKGGESLPVLTNQSFWELRALPRSIVFLGGGVISAELGQALARFGSSVTIIERDPRILEAADEEVSALATEVLKREGVEILTNSEVVLCEQIEPGKIRLSLNQNGQPKDIFAENLFAALGRMPNTSDLQLGQAGVAFSESGIQVHEYLQTTAPNIYACGDVASPAKFTHIASYQAEICVENILSGNHILNDLSLVPWAIFMEPEIGHVGLSEAEARRKFDAVNVSRVATGSIDRFITESETIGFVKVLMDENDVILGADAIGAHAGEWIQFFTLAIKQKLTLQALAETIFIYPTFSEIVKKAAARYLRTKQTAYHKVGSVN